MDIGCDGKSNLEFQSMLLFTVFLYLWVHPLHQGVPLHQHVGEGGAGEDAHHLGAERGQVLQTPGEDLVHRILVPGRHVMSLRAN